MPASVKTIDGVKKASIAIGGILVTDASVELAVWNQCEIKKQQWDEFSFFFGIFIVYLRHNGMSHNCHRTDSFMV